MDTLTFQYYQQRLIKELQTQQSIAPRVTEAFLHVPRHLFVSHYYERQSGSHEWTRYEQSETAEWYEHVYQDQGLVTQVDGQRRILSSSSQPGIMASMLNALVVEPGMRVLEIGTGTGYNAGLLAALAKDPHLVTTLDIDGPAVERARTVLTHTVGEGITVVQGDGFKGFPEHAPYDRIIVTASAPTVSLSWAKQLAPDGLLICILQPRYAAFGGVLVVKKQSDGLLRGDRLSAYQLWNRFTSIYSCWLHYEQPRITQYEFEMDSTSGYQALFLTTDHGRLWPFE